MAAAFEQAWLLLKDHKPDFNKRTDEWPIEPLAEMDSRELHSLYDGRPGYDAGEGRFSYEDTKHPDGEVREAAKRELFRRLLETEGANMSHLFVRSPSELRQIEEFYKPQFDDFMGRFGEYVGADDVADFIPGQTYLLPDMGDDEGKFRYRDFYEYLKENAPPHVAEQYLSRYRNFMASANENPEYLSQYIKHRLFGGDEPTAPQYLHELPEGEGIFDVSPPKMPFIMGPIDSTGFNEDWQNAQKGEPIDLAFRLLKQGRQTTLGEYHPDFPSPYGPVKWYHGTTVEPASRINFEGLRPSEPNYNTSENAFPKGVYATSDYEKAQNYANWRGKDRNQQGRVIGIREGVGEQPVQGDVEEDYRFDAAIPRAQVVPMPRA